MIIPPILPRRSLDIIESHKEGKDPNHEGIFQLHLLLLSTYAHYRFLAYSLDKIIRGSIQVQAVTQKLGILGMSKKTCERRLFSA